MPQRLPRRLHRVLRLLEHFEPVRAEGDTLWDGPFFIPRSGLWWPTSFLRYQNQLFCSVEMGWSRPRLTWTVGTTEVHFEGAPPIGSTVLIDELLWGRVLEQVESRLRKAVENEAAFNARVARQLPMTSRTGKVLRKFSRSPRERGPMSRRQLVRLESALERAQRAQGLQRLSRREYLRVAAIAYDAGFPDLRTLTAEAKYRRRADGRHGGLLDLPARDTAAFHRWFTTRAWSGSHPWELVFAHPHGVLLSPDLVAQQWRFHLWAGTPGLYVTAALMAIALGDAGVPFELSHRDAVLAALRGVDLIDVGPFYGQLSLEELEQAHPGATRHVVWADAPRLRARPARREHQR